MNEKDELVNICNEIYNKHHTALRLIYENISIDDSIEKDIVRSVLNEYSSNGSIIFTGENRYNKLRFFTERLDQLLPPLSGPNSWCKTKWIYCYYFDLKPDKNNNIYLHLILELGLTNVPENIRETQVKLIQLSHKNKTIKENSSSSKLFNLKRKIDSNSYEESVLKNAKELIDQGLEKQKELISKLNNSIVTVSTKNNDDI